MNKKADFNFEWIFALIVGAAILVLAIYGATKIGENLRYQTDTEVAKQISIITDPLQAGFAAGSSGKITFVQETRINNLCLEDGFGKNEISVSSRSGIGKDWIKEGAATSIHNKYIFSSEAQGKEFYVFSKPFNLPYKVSDMIMLISRDYCFVNAPQSIQDELDNFNIPKIKTENCSESSLKVCFDESGCDISVYGTCTSECESKYEEGYIEKKETSGLRVNYVDNLMYSAIFSDKGVYDCNVKRLLHRTSALAEMYVQKIELMSARECNSNLQADLTVFGGFAKNASSASLSTLNQMAKQIETREKEELCRAW